jgi:amino acid adenylation domain-containing protein
MERSPEMIMGILAILKAGGAYLPLDPGYPQDRLAYMIEDSGVKLILTQQDVQPKLPANAARQLCLDTEREVIARESATRVRSSVRPDHLAYIIYTSGSTGRPKGVLIEHRGLSNLVKVHGDQFQIRPGDRVLQFASISFDASVSEIFSALAQGAALCLARPDQLLPGPEFLKLLRDFAVNVATLPPTVLNALSEEHLPDLRTVISAGEACSLELARRWGRGRRFINAYGPTEGTVCATLQVITPDDTVITIGRPIANFQAYILDAELQPLPIGAQGELYIGGVGLARGYHNQPDLTAARFLANPFSSDPKARIYKTGDLARFRPDGTIQYLGRIDHQVKIRGFRVELGEIENVLGQFPGIRANVVVPREDTPGEKRLVAYLLDEGGKPNFIALREHLRAKLPEYMIPSAFVRLTALPLTLNGKVDRTALPAPDANDPGDPHTYAPPGTPTEIALGNIWRDVLGLTRVSIDENFFDLGGHSMLAVRLIGRIKRTLNRTVSIPQFFHNPTIRKMAAALDQESADSPLSAFYVAFQTRGNRTPVFFLHGDWLGAGFYCARLSEILGDERPFYALNPYRQGRQDVFELSEMVVHQLKVMRALVPHGPYILGGYCVGALVAVEMARVLIAQGEKVERLLLLDPSRAQARSLRWMWRLVDRAGAALRWDLLKRIHFYDRYAVSLIRWLRSTPRGKIEGLGRRLGLTTAGAAPEVIMDWHGEEDDPDIFRNLDYALYFLASCLQTMEPLAVPASIYFPAEDEGSAENETWGKKLFPEFTIERVPGTHHTCTSQYSHVVGERMKFALDGAEDPTVRLPGGPA